MQQAELIDSKEKLKELEDAANDGFARAQFNLGMCYEQGKWVEQDLPKAIHWYKKAAEQGQAKAQYNTAMGLRFLSQALFYDKIKLNHPNIK